MTNDVARTTLWLKQHGFSEYAKVFEENTVDLVALQNLDNAELGKLGVPIGDRIRLKKAIAGYKNDAPLQSANITRVIPSAADGAARAQRRNVTVMFIDLAESTQLSARLDPEDYAQTIRHFQSCTISIVEAWDGFVAQFFGDGVLAYFGWPSASENDAERAVRAALKITDKIATLQATDGSELACRIGIATGLVVVGDTVGDQSHEAIFGITPDLAAGLQSQARFGEVIISAATHQLVRNWFDTTLLGSFELDGIDGTTEVWRADSETSGATRFEAGLVDRTQLTPFSGRQDEITHITKKWQRAIEGIGGALLVSGEAGLGKSRLVREFVRDSKTAVGNVTYLQCSPFHKNTIAHPIVDHLSARVGLTPTLNSVIFLDRLYKILQASGVKDFQSAQRVGWFIGLGASNNPAGQSGGSMIDTESSASLQAARVRDIFVRYLTGLAMHTPLLVVVEDAHWMDATTAEILEQLLANIGDHTLLLVVTTRPDTETNWGTRIGDTIELKPLQKTDAAELTLSVAGQHGISDTALKTILQATNGIPLFLEEVTMMLMESGQLKSADDGQSIEDTESISVPHRLRDALVAKIDALPNAKSLLCLAATIGRDFSYDLLQRISDKDNFVLDAELAELIDAAILVVDENTEDPRFTFRHMLLHEAAYSMLLLADKTELHLRIAQALENQERPAPQILAHHYEQANDPAFAAEYLLLAGNQALERAAIKQALSLLQRGISLLDKIPAESSSTVVEPDRNANYEQLRLNLHASIGTAQMEARGWGAPEVDEAYRKALYYLPAAENTAQRLWVAWGAWVYQQVSGKINDAAALVQQIAMTSVQAGDPDSQLIAKMILLQSAFYRGRFLDCIARGEEFEALFDDKLHGHFKNQYSVDLLLVWYVHGAQVHWLIGNTQAANHYYSKIAARIPQVNHAHSHAWAITWGSNYLLLQGNPAEVLKLLPDAMTVAETHGFTYTASLGSIIETDAQLRCGIPEKSLDIGLTANAAALDMFQATGARIVLPWFQTRHAQMLGAQGKVELALEAIDQAIEQIETLGEWWCASYAFRVKGDLLLLQQHSDVTNAALCYRKALEVATDQSLGCWRQEAESSLNRLLALNPEQQR